MTGNPSPGGKELSALLKSLKPVLDPEIYVFTTVPKGELPDGLQPRMMFQETEGTTLILTQADAQAHNIDAVFPCRMITLSVHSSLEAVGMMAAISAALTDAGISCNPVAGYYHDHLFVPVDKELMAINVMTTAF